MLRLSLTALLFSAIAPLTYASTISSGEIDVPYSQEYGVEEFSFNLNSLDSPGSFSVSGYADGFANVSWPNAPGFTPLGATVSPNWGVQTENALGSATVNLITYPPVYGGPDMHFTIQPFTITGAGTYSVPFQVSSGGLQVYVVNGSLLPIINELNLQGSGVVTFQLVQSYCISATVCSSDTQDFYLANGNVSFVFSAPVASAPEASTWLTMAFASIMLGLEMKRRARRTGPEEGLSLKLFLRDDTTRR